MMSFFANDMAFMIDTQWLPFVFIIVGIILSMVLQILHRSQYAQFIVATISVLLAWVSSCGVTRVAHASSLIIFDQIGRAGLIIILPALLVIMWALFFTENDHEKKSQALLLLLISGFGAMTTLVVANWILFFVSIQCLSLPLYGLLLFKADNQFTLSASARYFVLSLVAMAFLLFGILCLYAATGTMNIYEQAHIIMFSVNSLFYVGFSLILVGLLFKASLFPFHMWAPDTYQGAPSFVVGYLIVVIKTVVLFFLLRCFFELFSSDWSIMKTTISIMAITSMWIGNSLALFEKNFIRLIAYLSIAHMGYLIIPVLAHSSAGVMAVFLDIAAFSVGILTVLLVTQMVVGHVRNLKLDEFSRLVHERPMAGWTLIVGLISMVGFPLTLGFVGKYAIFSASVQAQLWQMTVHMLLSSLLGLVALARIIIVSFAEVRPPHVSGFSSVSLAKNTVFAVFTAIILCAGFYPELFVMWAQEQSQEFSFDNAELRLSAKPTLQPIN